MQENYEKDLGGRIGRLLDRLSAVDEGKEIVRFFQEKNVHITFVQGCVAPAISNFVIERIENGKHIYSRFDIFLDPELDDSNLIQAIVHEAQHIRHHAAGLGNPPFLVSRSKHRLIRRVQEADAQAAATLVTYKLKLSGDDGPFHAAAKAGYACMNIAFEKAVHHDPNSLKNGQARRAAFNAWPQNRERVAHYDGNTDKIQSAVLRALLRKNLGHGFRRAGAEDIKRFIIAIGALSDDNYMAKPEALFPFNPSN